jgi:hypothetical protein
MVVASTRRESRHRPTTGDPAQWDHLLPESLTVSAAAAPSGTLTAVLVAAGLAVVLIVPDEPAKDRRAPMSDMTCTLSGSTGAPMFTSVRWTGRARCRPD